jgi:hypothetical protein
LHHLLACQNLQHLKLAPASLDGSSSFRGLTAAGLLVLAQLPPLTSAELVLNVSSSHWVHLPWISDTDLEDMLPVGLPNLGPQLRAPGVPQEVAEEVIQMCQERRWPFIVVGSWQQMVPSMQKCSAIARGACVQRFAKHCMLHHVK